MRKMLVPALLVSAFLTANSYAMQPPAGDGVNTVEAPPQTQSQIIVACDGHISLAGNFAKLVSGKVQLYKYVDAKGNSQLIDTLEGSCTIEPLIVYNPQNLPFAPIGQ